MTAKQKKPWILTRARSEALKKAQLTHVILINIGKKYRNKEINKFQFLKKNRPNKSK
jgi:hypothetical protein